MKPSLILFDFDGTLADTAPDLAAAANRQRERKGLAPLPYEQLRPVASQGARGLLRVALNLHPDHADYETWRQQFLDDYEQAMTVQTRLFAGVPELLQALEARALSWGIVTNKARRFTLPLLEHLGLQGAKAVVCGDCTPHLKPHPAPLLKASADVGFAPEHCWYVGDDKRDIEAGEAAGMLTVAAAYGYCGDAQPVSQWGAHHVIHHPEALLDALAA